MGMKDQKAAKEIAERRMIIIAPLLSLPMMSDDYYQKRREISEANEISIRTIQRYVDAYSEFGMDGLQPKGRVIGL